MLKDGPRAKDGFLHYRACRVRPVEQAIKRLVDVAAAGVALVLLSPLLLVTALAIRLGSPGPIFFRQVRVGLHGAQFTLLKFRSMVVSAEAEKAALLALNEAGGPLFKMKRDPRVTAVGRFIRKYSIDELPQLVNILRGDMTIVGPRPVLPAELAQFKPSHRRRLAVRPGLTCYWQVGGRDDIGFEDRMRMDLQYVDNWSLAVDLMLILKTIPVVVTGRNAS
jgi:exopolysaccharide biosynthesis polyprenyl glycosylphosphotransferase